MRSRIDEGLAKYEADNKLKFSAEQRAKILQPDDIAAAALFVATLPAHVSVPELVIKPVGQMYS